MKKLKKQSNKFIKSQEFPNKKCKFRLNYMKMMNKFNKFWTKSNKLNKTFLILIIQKSITFLVEIFL